METKDLKQKLTKTKGIGIAAGIIMMVVGTAMCFFPLITSEIALWLFFAGMIVYGVYAIIKFIIQPKGQKNGWLLANGILMILLSSLMIMAILLNAQYLRGEDAENPLIQSNAIVLFWIFVFLGFWAIFNGIFRLCTISQIAGPAKGWTIAASICDIAIGLMMVIFPTFGTYYIIMIAFAIYMIMMGVVVIIGAAKVDELNSKIPEEKKVDTIDTTKK
jgi:uncharacterized membrane protein HdeD (DUF308 family)